jgi:transcriptional regulator with XRE-family HTH domain
MIDNGTVGSFGVELRRRRLECGLSLSLLARRINYSKSHLSKVEADVKRPSVVMALACDRELKADGALARMIIAQVPHRVPDLEQQFYEVIQLNGDSDHIDLPCFPRRPLLAAGAVAIVGWTVVAAPGRSASADTILSSFRRTFAELRQLGQESDPAIVGQLLIAATNALEGVAVGVSQSATRSAAFGLTARYAEYTGWMAQEKGNDSAALWWTSRAVELARECNDQEMMSYGMVRRAELALFAGDATATVALARKVQQSKCGPRVRGFAALREAQGHAMMHDERGTHSALDVARNLMAQSAQDQPAQPVLGSVNMTDPVAFAEALCHLDLGQPDSAGRILATEIMQLSHGARRNRARYGAHLALAQAEAGNVECACDVLEDVLTNARTVDSATIRGTLRQCRQVISRWRNNDRVRDLSPRLSAALHSGAHQVD